MDWYTVGVVVKIAATVAALIMSIVALVRANKGLKEVERILASRRSPVMQMNIPKWTDQQIQQIAREIETAMSKTGRNRC